MIRVITLLEALRQALESKGMDAPTARRIAWAQFENISRLDLPSVREMDLAIKRKRAYELSGKETAEVGALRGKCSRATFYRRAKAGRKLKDAA